MANHLERLAFIDETSVKTNMAKTTGLALGGQRLVDHAPFGHWRTQTFVGALRHDRMDAPWVFDGAMNGEMFDLYITTQLALTLRKGDVVIRTTCPATKALPLPAPCMPSAHGSCFCRPTAPTLASPKKQSTVLFSLRSSPIEMAFAKLKN